MLAEELLQRYQNGERFFAGADLRGANLTDADLTGANLRDAYLRDADLEDADLRDANLRGADLRDAYLTGANLRNAHLRNAYLEGAYLRDADLTGADLKNANLTDANLEKTILTNQSIPTRKELSVALIEHSKSDRYDQRKWCGTNCCLSGMAGSLIGNQSAGVALISQVLPEFDLSVLYGTDTEKTVNELNRVATIVEKEK